MTDPLSSEAALASFLEGFETGSWPGPEWKHVHHVIMAACYLTDLPLDTATQTIRTGIQRYNLSQGGQNTDTSGYHETLTIFWIRIIHRFLDTLPAGQSRLENARAVAAEFGPQRDLFKPYWSFDIVNSVEARRAWLPPNLASLD